MTALNETKKIALEAKTACVACYQPNGKHIEGCYYHPNYFKECLMDARYRRAMGGE